MPKRIDHTRSGPSPTPPGNTTICPECEKPTSNPAHVCAPKAVSA